MKTMKLLAIILAGVCIASLFFPWVKIGNNHQVIGGFYSDILIFGKPGLFHLLLTLFFISFLLISRLWSLRAAFFTGAFNIAWAIRNFISISACSGGICPVKQPALYFLLASSILMVVCTSFTTVKEKTNLSTQIE